MQNLLLTLAAAVIGAFVLFSIAAVSWRTNHASESAAQYAAAKTSLHRFVEILERDLSNLGAGLTNNTLTDTSPAGSTTDAYRGPFYATSGSPWDFTSSTRYLQFCSIANPEGIDTDELDPTANWGTGVSGTNPATGSCDVIRYEWTQTGTVTVRDETTSAHDYQTVPVYELERSVNGTVDGGSLNVLTDLDFEFFDISGTATTVPENVRSVRVTVKAVSPLRGSYTSSEDAALNYDVDQTRWSRTIRPPNLARVRATN